MSASFPDKFEVTHVFPIHKSNSKTELGNYRPVYLREWWITNYITLLKKA